MMRQKLQHSFCNSRTRNLPEDAGPRVASQD